jgi:hypothetical protein
MLPLVALIVAALVAGLSLGKRRHED